MTVNTSSGAHVSLEVEVQTFVPDPWQALRDIVNVLGPDRICRCKGACEGLRVEAADALQTARDALGMGLPDDA